MSPPTRRDAAAWGRLVTAVGAAWLLFALAHLPTPSLFAALVVGVGWALRARRTLLVPAGGMTGAQLLIGVSLGAELQSSTLRALGPALLPVALVVVATLAVSLGIGVVYARIARVDAPTSMLGLVAGGAGGIVAMADDYDADARLVAFMQYLRVLLVVLVAPVVAYLLLEGGGGEAPVSPERAGLAGDLAFTAGCALVGAWAASRVRVTAGLMLAPLLVAGAVSMSGLAGGAAVPDALEEVAFAVIGLEVGLRFTRATIREAGRLLPWTLSAVVVLVVACAGLAAALVPLAGVSFADAYLATTPGGMYAVLAASIGIGADSTFVVATQVLRMIVIVVAAPPIVRWATLGARRAAEETRPAFTPEP